MSAAPSSPRDSLGPNEVEGVEPYSPTRPQINDPIEFPVLGVSPQVSARAQRVHSPAEGPVDEAHERRHNLVGTAICRNVYALANGKWHFCGRDECHFAHSQSELRGAPCAYGEDCRRGDNCRFCHPSETVYDYYQRVGREFPSWLPATSELTRRPGTDKQRQQKAPKFVPAAQAAPKFVPQAAPSAPVQIASPVPVQPVAKKAPVLLRIRRADLVATMELLAAHNLDRPVTIEYTD